VRLTDLAIHDGPHDSDGLLLHAWDGPETISAFIRRRVMDDWVDPKQDGAKVSFARNTTRSVSATSLQLSESLRPNISEVRRSIANTPSWMCCSRISRKVARCLIE
jgi:hypothetical protein